MNETIKKLKKQNPPSMIKMWDQLVKVIVRLTEMEIDLEDLKNSIDNLKNTNQERFTDGK